MRLGDWARVVQLIEQGAGNDESLKRAYKNLGDYSAERQKWTKAAKYYGLA
jgi:WD repeat-containing protein 35